MTPVSPTAALWEGGKHAGTDTSIFVVRTPPGGFVELHTHPYSETFVLRRGAALFTVGDERFEAVGGQVLVVPAFTPHKFEKIGDETLESVHIHANDRFITEWLE